MDWFRALIFWFSCKTKIFRLCIWAAQGSVFYCSLIIVGDSRLQKAELLYHLWQQWRLLAYLLSHPDIPLHPTLCLTLLPAKPSSNSSLSHSSCTSYFHSSLFALSFLILLLYYDFFSFFFLFFCPNIEHIPLSKHILVTMLCLYVKPYTFFFLNLENNICWNAQQKVSVMQGCRAARQGKAWGQGVARITSWNECLKPADRSQRHCLMVRQMRKCHFSSTHTHKQTWNPTSPQRDCGSWWFLFLHFFLKSHFRLQKKLLEENYCH